MKTKTKKASETKSQRVARAVDEHMCGLMPRDEAVRFVMFMLVELGFTDDAIAAAASKASSRLWAKAIHEASTERR